MSNTTTKYVLLLGSNMGNRAQHLHTARVLIQQQIDADCQFSEVLETEPWGFKSETWFLNQAVLVQTTLSPQALLQQVLQIEETIGRVREQTQWVSRSIDIDILCAENLVLESENLTIPHKHLHERNFALKPLCQLAANWVHPHFQKSYQQLLSAISQPHSALSSYL